MRRVSLISGLVVLAAAACDFPRLPRLDGDGGGGGGNGGSGAACSASPDCKTAELPVCDTAKEGGQCVACTQAEHGVCGGMTPRCENDSCVACVTDGDCPGSVCLLNGACADAATVVHAVATGGASTSPCGLSGISACTLEQALLNARGKGPTVIKLDDAVVYAPTTGNFRVEPDADITIDVRAGATLTRRSASDGAVITVNGTGNASGKLTLLGGTVTGGHSGTNNPGDGVACNTGGTLVVDETHVTANDASAINAAGCAVTITRALIDNNSSGSLAAAVRISGGSITLVRSTIQSNRGGGLAVSSNAIMVAGNMIVANGDRNGVVGGVSISTTSASNRLEFNSIAENKVQDGIAAGVACATNTAFTAANNIIWNNNSVLATASIQVSGTCGHAYSDIGPTAVSSSTPTSNVQNIDPMFVNVTSDLHLTATSPLSVLAADPKADLAGIASLDIDGDHRAAPATMGADQPRAK